MFFVLSYSTSLTALCLFSIKERTGLTEIGPLRWAITPKIDKEGRPVKYLKTKKLGYVPHGPASTSIRDELIAAIKEVGLSRPHQYKRRRTSYGTRHQPQF
jgi:hypothetical protein